MPNTNYIYGREYLEDCNCNYESPDYDYAADARDYADATGDYDLSDFSIGGVKL